MKTVLVIPDGVADEPQPSLDHQTPLQAAVLPHMDEVARLGVVGRTDNVPASMPSGSDVGTMSLFGYDTLRFHTGRAPIEAAAQGIELEPGDWAIRCNLVTINSGRMQSFTAGQFPSVAAEQLIESLQRETCGSEHWKYHAGVSYRNLLIYRARGAAAPFDNQTQTTPPHDITDLNIDDYLPSGPGSSELLSLMEDSRRLFAKSNANVRRLDADELPATQTWLWGQGSRPELEPFFERYGARGAVITAVDLLRGMGRLIGWDVIEVDGATGYLDTDYKAKGLAAIKALERDDLDFLVVHVEATDEASHEGDTDAKLQAVQQIDKHIVGPVHAWLKQQQQYRLLICPDHPTYLRTKTHSHGYCPFAACGSGFEQDSHTEYHEVTAAASDLSFPAGHELMGWFQPRA
ncbi:MAG: cofactor-independent phosphoglycerate mutase [Fuerstiella sp.]|nr:cofactor-independent phosphoglycerate mutase [Fuerstiella sp.]